MTKDNQPKLTLFKNDLAGKPKLKDGKPIIYNNFELKHGVFNAIIDLPEGLEKGEYVAEIYTSTSKAGNQYYWGKIRKKFKQKEVDPHNQAKANGYVDDISDEITF